ncbi:MAG: 4-(cytidine 5'-diphospho)-2-C-methyl-D-erythritol kinase [Rhodospirillaceae bacterium]|nr:4-(cytidine 5'-diphospho)-2-C-methyl-D-erythritol kinase [Rhodospirillaceae bacterium]
MTVPLALACAKINLYLHVVGRRDDGYHLLDSMIVFAEAGDHIVVSPAADFILTIDGPFGAGLTTGPDNLVLRAARALQEMCGVADGAAIHLTKNLPLASGIGGGSADAAATLYSLIDLWQVEVDRLALFRLAETLGADVPACLLGQPCFVRGVGEKVQQAGLVPPAYLLLVNPLVETPTPAVFKARRGDFSAPVHWNLPPGMKRISVNPSAREFAEAIRTSCRNDLTEAAICVTPAIADVLAAIEATDDCLLARLSGSGATCFGLYESAATADAAHRQIKTRHPNWWTVSAPIAR